MFQQAALQQYKIDQKRLIFLRLKCWTKGSTQEVVRRRPVSTCYGSQVNCCCCFDYSTRLALLARVMNIHVRNRGPDKRFILARPTAQTRK